MKTAFIDSHLFCPRDHKRLVQEIAPDENSGDISILHYCISCDYREHAPRTVAEAHRRSDVPQLRSLRESLAKLRLEGVVVPLRIDDSPFPDMDPATGVGP